MIACKQVARALARQHVSKMPWWRRLPLRVHIRLCLMCGKHHRQVVSIQKGVDKFLEFEVSEDTQSLATLSAAARQRIEQAMTDSKK